MSESGRVRSREQKDLRKEVLVSPAPELGLIAMNGPNDPEPELVVKGGRVGRLELGQERQELLRAAHLVHDAQLVEVLIVFLDGELGVARLLGLEQIGMTLSDGYAVMPEQSTVAIIAHHPQAVYFGMKSGFIPEDKAPDELIAGTERGGAVPPEREPVET